MNARNIARRIINNNIYDLGCPFGLSDLSDTAILCDYLDTIQEMIEEDPDWKNNEEIIEVAKEAAYEILLEEGFPIMDPKTGHLVGATSTPWEE
jgi:hypothetical protein